jgi:hypothetical protein
MEHKERCAYWSELILSMGDYHHLITNVPLEQPHRIIYFCYFQFRLLCGFQVREAESTHSQRKCAHTAGRSPNSAKPAWPESKRPSDRLLSAKLVPTFEDREVPRGQRDGSLCRILGFLDWSSSSCTHEAEFQIHYFSENLVAPGIEPEPLDRYPGTLTTRPQRRSPKS